MIVASLGLSLGAISTEIFSIVAIMSILTTLVAPPFLRLLYRGHPEAAISPEDAESPAGLLPDLEQEVRRAARPYRLKTAATECPRPTACARHTARNCTRSCGEVCGFRFTCLRPRMPSLPSATPASFPSLPMG